MVAKLPSLTRSDGHPDELRRLAGRVGHVPSGNGGKAVGDRQWGRQSPLLYPFMPFQSDRGAEGWPAVGERPSAF